MPQAANRELSSHSSLQVSSRRLPKRTRVNRRRCRVTRVAELTSRAAGGFRFRLRLALAAIALTVALAVAVVTLDVRELLHAAAVDRLAGVEVALRVEHDAVQERKLACLESRRAKPGEDRAHHAVHDVQDLVPSVDLEHQRLHIVVGEREVPRRARSAESRYAADSQRHASTRNDRIQVFTKTGALAH